jgi:HSP20 family molecular chaperone IbpA
VKDLPEVRRKRPAVDILDRAGDILLKAEIPGLEKDDFTVEAKHLRIKVS